MTVSTGEADVIVSDDVAYEGKGTCWVGESGEDKEAQVTIDGGLALSRFRRGRVSQK